MNKTAVAMLACCALTAGALFAGAPDAATYFSFLPAADRQTLLAQSELTHVGSSRATLPLTKGTPWAPAVASGLTVAGGTVAIEGVFLFPRPAGDVKLTLYNALHAVASMEGLQYYSVSRKRMEPLVLASWRVAETNRQQKLADPTFTTIPGFQKAVVFQKDNKLGDGFSEVTWRAQDDGFVMTFRNLDALRFGILPLVDAGNLQMLFVIVPLADKVAVYGVMEGKTASLLGLERSKDESFRNRMRALASWLGQRIAATR